MALFSIAKNEILEANDKNIENFRKNMKNQINKKIFLNERT